MLHPIYIKHVSNPLILTTRRPSSDDDPVPSGRPIVSEYFTSLDRPITCIDDYVPSGVPSVAHMARKAMCGLPHGHT